MNTPTQNNTNRFPMVRWSPGFRRVAEISAIPGGLAMTDTTNSGPEKSTRLIAIRRRQTFQGVGQVSRPIYRGAPSMKIHEDELEKFGAEITFPFGKVTVTVAAAASPNGGWAGLAIETDGKQALFADAGPGYALPKETLETASDVAAGVAVFLAAAPRRGAGEAAVAGGLVILARSGLRALISALA
jgi:hypothetical protein